MPCSAVNDLASLDTKQLQIWAMQKQLEIPADAHWAMVTLTTNAAPDDLIQEIHRRARRALRR